MRQLDLTHLQLTVLAMAAWTNRGGNPVVKAEIARFGDTHPMQVSLVLKALERKGMILVDLALEEPIAPCQSAKITVLDRRLSRG